MPITATEQSNTERCEQFLLHMLKKWHGQFSAVEWGSDAKEHGMVVFMQYHNSMAVIGGDDPTFCDYIETIDEVVYFDEAGFVRLDSDDDQLTQLIQVEAAVALPTGITDTHPLSCVSTDFELANDDANAANICRAYVATADAVREAVLLTRARPRSNIATIGYDCADVAEKEIAPLVKLLIKRCRHHGLPLMTMIEFSRHGKDVGIIVGTDDGGGRASPAFNHLLNQYQWYVDD